MKKNTLMLAVFGINFILPALHQESFGQAPRKVLLEEYTGAWCGACPAAGTEMENMLKTYPNVIGIANHSGTSNIDKMANLYTNTLRDEIVAPGLPEGTIDRYKFSGEQYVSMYHAKWKSKIISRLSVSAPVAVTISSTYNSNTKALSVTVTANFVASASGDMRINCILVEDSVTDGIGTGYDQKNYMGQGCTFSDPTSPWYTYPCILVGFKHPHVARTNLAADYWGTAGVIPASVTSSSTYSKTYTYTLPATWNASRMSIVAFVSYYSTNINLRSVLNANSVKLGSNTGAATEITDSENRNDIEVKQNTPNPFNDITAIQFQLTTTDNVSVKVYDVYGQEVKTLANTHLAPGEHTFYWPGDDNNGNPVSGGVYFYTLSVSSQIVSKQMIFIKQ